MLAVIHFPEQMPTIQPHEFTGQIPVPLSPELTGIDLMQTLHYIGVINPGELARILEEEDPLKVRSVALIRHSRCTVFSRPV